MKNYLISASMMLLIAGNSPANAQDSVAAAVATVAEPSGPTASPANAAPETASFAPTSAAADGCELHIWPAERMNSITMGLLGGGLLDAAIHANRDASNRTLLASALDSPSQLDALLALDLRTMLKMSPGTTIVTHAKPLERKTMNAVKTRRSDSKSTCYSELIVADVFYQKSTLYGRSLRTLFMVREFGKDQTIDFEYKAWGGNGLQRFPPKEGEDALAALDELVSVFKANFAEYANNEAKAVRKPVKS
ncbi:hypothetical protein [Rhizorhabdus sp. FW153]|uniref:hypothetical protein n=1 Tax=Rhizorhabdus sp. FW153 TaxID=3400216 RepID=UPI003CF8E89A